MPRSKRRVDIQGVGHDAPALTPEGRDDQLAALAYNLAEQRLRDGTASNSLIERIMQYGSVKNRLEMEKLRRENELLVAKVEAIKSTARTEELFSEAIKAMKSYSMDEEDDDEQFDY